LKLDFYSANFSKVKVWDCHTLDRSKQWNSVNPGYLNSNSQHATAMKAEKQKRLEAKGWKIGDAADFLELSSEEAVIIEMRLALSRSLKERRKALMTQAELATKISSSQPRVAMAENGDSSVSIELLIRAMLATGLSPQEIGQIIANVA
jgi:DNA-binding XRE family transcriptional regulator